MNNKTKNPWAKNTGARPHIHYKAYVKLRLNDGSIIDRAYASEQNWERMSLPENIDEWKYCEVECPPCNKTGE